MRLRDSLGKRAEHLSAFACAQSRAPAGPTAGGEQTCPLGAIILSFFGGSRKITKGTCIQYKKARNYRRQ